MEKKVLAYKMNLNLYYVSAAASLVLFVLTLIGLFLSGINMDEIAFTKVLMLIILAFCLCLGIFSLIRGRKIASYPRELIVCENGRLTAYTDKGRQELPLCEVLEMDLCLSGGKSELLFRNSAAARHRVEIRTTRGVLIVDAVENVQETLRNFWEVKSGSEKGHDFPRGV